MADKPELAEEKSPETPAPPPRRSPGHRGQDVRDTVAEMALKAQEISQEAGSKMAAAMKDVINAAAGLTAFAAESARDLVQYMVRRGQMTQEEADKLIIEAEAAAAKRKPPEPRVDSRVSSARADAARADAAPAAKAPATKAPVAKPPAVKAPAVKSGGSAKAAGKPAGKATKSPATRSAKSPAAKAPAAKKKAPAKSKAAPKAAAKKKR